MQKIWNLKQKEEEEQKSVEREITFFLRAAHTHKSTSSELRAYTRRIYMRYLYGMPKYFSQTANGKHFLNSAGVQK